MLLDQANQCKDELNEIGIKDVSIVNDQYPEKEYPDWYIIRILNPYSSLYSEDICYKNFKMHQMIIDIIKIAKNL